MAEPELVIFGTSGSKVISADIAKLLNVPLGQVDDEPFPNGESHVRLKSNVRSRDVFIICSTSRQWMHNVGGRAYTGVNDSLMELLVYGDACARASAWRITAVIPYFGYARQDRKAEGRTPITARLVANLIVEAGFNRVLTMDLHSDQIQGFFPKTVPLDHLTAAPLFAKYFTDCNFANAVVLSADVGNVKKADKCRSGMPSHYDIAVIDKRRKDGHNTEPKRLIGEVEGRTVILMDDIIATGGTIINAVEFAKKQGAKEFYIAGTHAELVGSAVTKLQHPAIKEIVITDTIQPTPETSALPIKMLSVAGLMSDAISRIHEGRSVSELLGIYG